MQNGIYLRGLEIVFVANGICFFYSCWHRIRKDYLHDDIGLTN